MILVARSALDAFLQAFERIERFLPHVIGAALFALPFLFPLGIGRDYPNHLARVFIEYRLHLDAGLANNYALDWFVVPDLAMDIFAAPMASWLSPYIVGSLFNSLTLVLLFTGAVVLNRRWVGAPGGAWPLLGAAVLFNESLHWGFMNFLFACGLCLWTFYFWLESEHWPRWRRLVLFSLAQLALFFAHVLGFLLCGYMILVLELVRFWRDKQLSFARRSGELVFNMLQFAIPLLLFGYVLFAQEGVGTDVTGLGNLASRAVALFSLVATLDHNISPIVLVCTVLLVYIVLRQRLAEIDRHLLPVAIALGVLVVAMPVAVLGIWGLHFRYPFFAFLFLVAAIRPKSRSTGMRLAEAGCAFLALFVIAAASAEFSKTDRRHQELREAFALAEPGSALLPVAQHDPLCDDCLPQPIDEIHAAALGVIERQMFLPILFTATSPVAASQSRHDLDAPGGLPISVSQLLEGRGLPLPKRGPHHDRSHPYWYSWDEHFDYVLWLRQDSTDLDRIAGLQRLASGEVFVLYRIDRESDGGAAGDRTGTE